jgi:DNA topoisomerase-2
MASKKSAKTKSSEPKIEDIYKKKTLHQHILSAPDTYIGSASCSSEEMWVFDRKRGKIILKDITFPPGLYKINDELFVNSRDHSVRDPTCKNIMITVNQEENTIIVYNDGNGIPIEMHKDVNVYVPEMIFGHLLTSSNYEVKGKTVGGKNGYGAKLANIYSEEFIVDTVDKVRKKKYVQKFLNNMYTVNPAEITNVNAKVEPYTKITFKPDLQKFGINRLTDDIVALLEKRVYDLAACTHNKVSVYLNGMLIKINSFDDYIRLYYDQLPSEFVYQEFNNRWKVGVLFDPSNGFRQVSFVNGICTYQGGTHVNHVFDQLSRELIAHIKDKNKNTSIKASYIKDNITLFIDSIIEDPSFKSQTKEELTTKVSEFGSKCEMTSDFIKKVMKTGIVEEVVRLAEFKHMSELAKTDYKKTNNVKSIEKLDDAQWAGTRKSKQCRLFLTEGDSAKSFAIEGLDVVGRERYGVFPLRGKLLNVREATVSQILKNEEFKSLKQILGLKQGHKYNDVSKLRYGGIIILTDQDHDGSHIKGLIINMIATYWPSLLKIDGFIHCMSTPVIKAFKHSKRQNPICFYTINSYKNWIENELKGNTSNYTIKYYKGLGTSTSEEAKEVFNDFENRLVKYVWEMVDGNNKQNIVAPIDDGNAEIEIENDTESSTVDADNVDQNDEDDDINSKSYDSITLAFEKLRAKDRKKWLFHYNKNDILDVDNKEVTYSDFINKELIHFSAYSNQRSIPSIIDGFKPSHRKIIFGCFKRKMESDEVKVAQLGAYIAENTLYHHGEESLYKTIIKMAQTFVGSNNINLLLPLGNFGNRRQGGKDSASPRYIYTQLNKLTPLIFRRNDECIYDYVDEDGTSVEPEVYAPIIPFVLVNGAEGIGTGFSTFVPPYNPHNIVRNLKLRLNGGDSEEMVPWFHGFKGEVKVLKDGKVQTSGIYNVVDDKTVRVTELPIEFWTEDYKEYLDSIQVDSKSSTKTKFVESYINNSGNNTIDFIITFADNELQRIIKSGTLEKNLKLTATISLNNMYLHNSKGTITKYITADDIIDEFYKYRLNIYSKRKQFVLKLYENELKILEAKVRFIDCILSEKIKIKKREEDDVIQDIRANGFEELSYNIESDKPSYRYLTDMKLFSLTKNKMKELAEERDKKRKEYELYAKTTIKELWTRELDEFLIEYDKWINSLNQCDGKNTKAKRGKSKTTTTIKVKGKGRGKALKQNTN